MSERWERTCLKCGGNDVVDYVYGCEHTTWPEPDYVGPGQVSEFYDDDEERDQALLEMGWEAWYRDGVYPQGYYPCHPTKRGAALLAKEQLAWAHALKSFFGWLCEPVPCAGCGGAGYQIVTQASSGSEWNEPCGVCSVDAGQGVEFKVCTQVARMDVVCGWYEDCDYSCFDDAQDMYDVEWQDDDQYDHLLFERRVEISYMLHGSRVGKTSWERGELSDIAKAIGTEKGADSVVVTDPYAKASARWERP